MQLLVKLPLMLVDPRCGRLQYLLLGSATRLISQHFSSGGLVLHGRTAVGDRFGWRFFGGLRLVRLAEEEKSVFCGFDAFGQTDGLVLSDLDGIVQLQSIPADV